MGNLCKIRCSNEIKGPNQKYYEGYKRCGRCEYYILTDRIYCYCCGQKYRTRPKQWKRRQKALAVVKRN